MLEKSHYNNKYPNTGKKGVVDYETISELLEYNQAIPAQETDKAYVKETNSFYDWRVGDNSVADGVNIIAQKSGKGRWVKIGNTENISADTVVIPEQRICLNTAIPIFTPLDNNNPTTAEVESYVTTNNINTNGTQVVYFTDGTCDEPDFIWTLNGVEITLSYVKQISQSDLIFEENFTGTNYNTSVIQSFNDATLSFEQANDRLAVTISNNDRGVLINADALGLVAKEWYTIEVAYSGAASLKIMGAWSNSDLPISSHFSSPAVHYHLQSSTGNGIFHSPIIFGQNITGSLTYYITKIRVYRSIPQNSNLKNTTGAIVIGANIKSDGPNVNGVVIGNNITATSSAQKDILIGSGIVGINTGTPSGSNVVVGADASIADNLTFGGSTNPDRTALGARTKATAWRATAIGANAQALNTSATAIGMGAVSEVAHGVALGRGSYIPIESNLSNALVLEGNDIYLSNGWGNRCDLPPSNIDILESQASINPAIVESTIHGKDAFDARATPTETNVQGGSLSLAAGRGTGNAIGGSVKIKTAPAGGSSNNIKNSLVTVAEFDAAGTSKFNGNIRVTAIPSYATTALAAADVALLAGTMFKVTNGNGTSQIHIKD